MQKAKAVNLLAALAFLLADIFLSCFYLSRFTSAVKLIAAV